MWAYFAHPNIRQKQDNDESNDEENNVKISLSEKLNQVQVNETDDHDGKFMISMKMNHHLMRTKISQKLK